jgi:LmbE family N-acetylglucosaminyl deacetylase
MNVLVVVAHPDDETLGCGATIAKLSDQGNSVRVLTFTDGVGAREDKNSVERISSLYTVQNILGIEDFASFAFPDNMMDSVPLLSIVKKIESYVSDNNFIPDWVVTHSPYCLNIDHRVVCNATLTTFRGLSHLNPIKILCFETPSSSEWNPTRQFLPNIYIDVQKYYKKKIEALSAYESEMREFPHPRSFKNILNLLETHGAEVGFEKAERFMLLRETIC